MTARAAYTNAALFAHGALSAAQAEHLCHSQGLALFRTERGNYALVTKPAAPREPETARAGAESPPFSAHADAAGHEWHDFRDANGRPGEKRDVGSWSDWPNNQQPEHQPGMGKR